MVGAVNVAWGLFRLIEEGQNLACPQPSWFAYNNSEGPIQDMTPLAWIDLVSSYCGMIAMRIEKMIKVS